MRRWTCERCGSGVLGPERPRRDDVRRYCLPCSEATGRLVERSCPALDRARAATRERAAAKRATQRSRTQAAEVARRTAGPFDLEAEARRFWRLPVMQEQPKWQRTLPEFTWRRSASKVRTSGRCYYREHRVVVTIGSDPFEAVEVVLHELVHAAIGARYGDGAMVHHGERFYRVLTRACREAWPDVEFPPGVMDLRTAWERDQWLASRIRAGLESST